MRNTKPRYTQIRGLPANTTLANNTGVEGPPLALTGAEMRSHLGLGTAAVTSAAAYDAAGTAAAAVAAEAGTRAAADAALTSAVNAKLDAAAVGANNGVAPLDGGGKVAATYLPSFVDDVLEAADLAAFPVNGETGKIYVALDTGKTYRWSGSAYVEISASPGSTDAVTEGATNQYFTAARVRAVVLTGLSLATNQAIAATDTALQAMGYLGARCNALWSRQIATGTGLSGGGDLSADRTLSLADTAVTPGSYTNANVTVDAQGRITSAANGSGGGAAADAAKAVSGMWYAGQDPISQGSSIAIAANTLYLCPFRFMTQETWDAIFTHVNTTGTATLAHLGIYEADFTTGPPTFTLLQDAGTVSLGSTGSKSITGLGRTIAAGKMVFLAILADGTWNNLGTTGANVRQALLHGHNGSIGGGLMTHYMKAVAFGALPASVTGVSNGSSNLPSTGLRIA